MKVYAVARYQAIWLVAISGNDGWFINGLCLPMTIIKPVAESNERSITNNELLLVDL